MEIFLTAHALGHVIARHISMSELSAILAHPAHTEVRAGVVVYDGIVNGRILRVVVARDSDPIRIISAYPRRRLP